MACPDDFRARLAWAEIVTMLDGAGSAAGGKSGNEDERRLLLAVLLGALLWRGVGFFGFGRGFGKLFVAGIVEGGAEADVDGEALACAPFVDAANRGNVAVVAAVGYADVAEFDGEAECGIEANPALAGKEDFCPGVGGLAADDFFLFGSGAGAAADQIARDIARGQAAHSNYTQ